MRVLDKQCFCGHAGSEFPFSIIDRGERSAEVERILAILMESRVGPGVVYEYLPPIFSFPNERNVNYDLTPSWSFAVVPGAMLADPRSGSHVNKITVAEGSTPFQMYRPSHIQPQALARGSPFLPIVRTSSHHLSTDLDL